MTSILEAGGLCAISVTCTAFICFFAREFASALELVDAPNGARKRHLHPTPLMGGIAVLSPTLVLSLLYSAVIAHNHFLVIALMLTFVILVIGIADDRYDLSPLLRMAIFALLIFGVLSFEPFFVLGSLRFFVGSDILQLHLGLLGIPLTALLIIGFLNATNMADGINGQLLGSILIWSLFIAYHLGITLGIPYLILATSAGAALFFNLQSKLFSGSAGAYAGSLMIGLGAIAAFHFSNDKMSALLPLLWFWLPVTDCVRLMIVRPLEKRSPFAADRGHFHHMLLEIFRSRSTALPVYLSLLAVPGFVAEFNSVAGLLALAVCAISYVVLVAEGPKVAAQQVTLRVRTKVAEQRAPDGRFPAAELAATSIVALTS